MGLLKYKIRNDFIGENTVLDGLTGSTSGITSSIVDRSTLNQYKFIPLNIPLDFKPMDRGELIPNFVVSEREKAINKVYDAEKTKWFFWPDYIILGFLMEQHSHLIIKVMDLKCQILFL